MTVLTESADTFITSLEKAEADLKAVAHRLEEGFAQQCGRHQVRSTRARANCKLALICESFTWFQVNLFHLALRIRRLERCIIDSTPVHASQQDSSAS